MLRRLVWGVGLLAAGFWLGCRPEIAPLADGQRIVSLSPLISRVLLALGAGNEIVAVDRFSRELPELETLPSLGGLFSPDLERTLELRPTLVLAVRSAQQTPFFNQLRARGVRVEEIEVDPFPIPHDAARPVGFVLEGNGARVGIVTDLGQATTLVVQRLRGCHALMIEANHDDAMLRDGPYPWRLKQRVGGRMALMHDSACHLKTFGDALLVGRACDEAGFFWYEDPYSDGGVTPFSHARLRELIRTPLLQGEKVKTIEQRMDLILQKATDFIRGDVRTHGSWESIRPGSLEPVSTCSISLPATSPARQPICRESAG